MAKKAPPEQWQNRIVGYGEESPEQLLANPLNFRIHSKHQQDALLGALEEVGVVQDVIINKDTGFLVDGHLRVTLAMRTGQATIPVKYVSLSEHEERLILATFDPISALATTDAQKLDELLHEVSTGSAAIQQMLDDMATSAGLYLDRPVGAGGDEFDTTPQEGPTRTQLGDLWQLGEHRLIVGDSTDRATVERLMDGKRADFCFTDPPYNVGVEYGSATNDSQARSDFMAWCKKWLAHTPRPLLMTVGIKRLLWWDEIAGDPQWIIAWVKRNGQGQTGLGGTNKWDAILVYGAIPDHNIDMIEVSNDYSEGIKTEGKHPTAKPIELWKSVLERFSASRALVYEPFTGSGTTLVACERLGRKCYGCEIEPKYGDVILRRWEAETGQEAVLLERLELVNLQG